jgi:hypothetical protein
MNSRLSSECDLVHSLDETRIPRIYRARCGSLAHRKSISRGVSARDAILRCFTGVAIWGNLAQIGECSCGLHLAWRRRPYRHRLDVVSVVPLYEIGRSSVEFARIRLVAEGQIAEPDAKAG